jgi:hypothetical protein
MRDRDVRGAILRQLAMEHAGDSDTRIVEEMGVWAGSVRIDVAVINGEMCGYELKSERDTLTRLPLQAQIYNKVFDKVVLVVGSRHLKKAVERIPEWWGVIQAMQGDTALELVDIRKPKQNPQPDPLIVAQLLRKDEALQILEQFDMAHGVKTKRVKFVHERLARGLPYAELTLHVRTALKAREDWLRKVGPHSLDVTADPDLNPPL